MPIYCDSEILEQNWLNWLIASATPSLEDYRKNGLLASKVISLSPDYDPFWGNKFKPARSHCFVCDDPIFCNSYSGKIDKPKRYVNGKVQTCDFPPTTSLSNHGIIDKMAMKGYILEKPLDDSWEVMVTSIRLMCGGISKKFTLSDEARSDLESESLVQILNKFRNLKLMYTPGLAPVFNLLTTTIYRTMCSVLGKERKDQKNTVKYASYKAGKMRAFVDKNNMDRLPQQFTTIR